VRATVVRRIAQTGGGGIVQAHTVVVMDHLAIPVRDQERSRRFYETYFGFARDPLGATRTAC